MCFKFSVVVVPREKLEGRFVSSRSVGMGGDESFLESIELV